MLLGSGKPWQNFKTCFPKRHIHRCIKKKCTAAGRKGKEREGYQVAAPKEQQEIVPFTRHT